MENNYVGYTLFHQYDLISYNIKKFYVRPRDVSYVTTKTIGSRILTELLLNCGQVVYVTEELQKVMEAVSRW